MYSELNLRRDPFRNFGSFPWPTTQLASANRAVRFLPRFGTWEWIVLP